MLCCVPKKENSQWEDASEMVFQNQNATTLAGDHSTHEDTARKPIPTVVLTSYNDEKRVQNEGDQLKTQENEGQSPSLPVTLEVPTRKRIQRSQRLTHQFEGAAIDGENVTETDGPSHHWSIASSVSSSVSDSSTLSSYQTASSCPTRDHSSTSGGGLLVKDTMTLPQTLKDELLHGVKQLLEERMTEMEQKIESNQHRLEARVDSVEKQLQEICRDKNRLFPAMTGGNGMEKVPSAAVLDTVQEDPNEDEVDEVKKKITSTSSLQLSHDSLAPGTTRRRLYTDSEAMKMAQHERRRHEFAKKKSQSLHHSQLFQKTCDQQVIMWLTQKVTNWKFLGRWLGLPENVLSRIEADNPKADREQCYQMFLRWKESDPENYTYPVLGDALQNESQELYNEFVEKVECVRVETTTF